MDWRGRSLPSDFPGISDLPCLPELLATAQGAPITTAEQWAARRPELLERLTGALFGALPAPPAVTSPTLLHAATLRDFHGAELQSVRIRADGAVAFGLQVYIPRGVAPAPVVLCGDGCWHNVSDAVIHEVLDRGFALAVFNRTEVMADPAAGLREGEAADIPRCDALAGERCGALAAWAWGHHRAVDILEGMDRLDPSRIAVVGHSRGGKAALLAGATDTRIALTSANNSGAGGAGSFLWAGPGAETWADLQTHFGHWLSPDLPAHGPLPDDLDMHLLKALIAPRALLTTEALDDLWANPSGTWLTHLAARKVYELVGASDRIGIAFREGGHAHLPQDWTTFLDFACKVL